LGSNNLFTGAVSLINTGPNAVSIKNVAATGLKFAGTTNIGGNLTATTTADPISELGSIIVAGTSSFTAGANSIDLSTNGGTNSFGGAVSLSNSGAFDVSINNDINLALGTSTLGRNLTVTTTNDSITQTGILTVPGTSSFTAGTNFIDLSTSNNVFTGAVSLSNNGAFDVAIKNNAGLILGASSVGQNFTASNLSANIAVNGAINALVGNVSLTAGAAAITQTVAGIITANTLTTNTKTGTTLNTATNVVSNFNASNTGLAVALTNSGALNITGISQTGTTLTITNTTGAITQTGGVITVTGASTFLSGANPIALNSNNAFTGAVTLTNSGTNDVSINNNIALSLAASTIAGNFTATTTPASNVAITQTGVLTVAGTSSFSAGANLINLSTSSNVLTGAVSLINTGPNAVSIKNVAATGLKFAGTTNIGGNLTATTTADPISELGSITVGGTSSFTAGANSIDLSTNGGTNSFGGAVSLSNSGTFDVSINNNINLILGTTGLGRNLTVTTVNNSITQNGILTVPGTSSFTAGTNLINLGTSSNVFTGAVTLSNNGAFDVAIKNNANLKFDTSTVGQNFTATTVGNRTITQIGSLTVPGTSSFSTSAAAITLSDPGNSLTGAITLNNTGATNPVTLNNSVSSSFNTSTVGGILTITSAGTITVNGALTSGATSGAHSIILSSVDFTNNVGAGALIPGAGNSFLIYVSDPSGPTVTYNNLASGNQARWNQTFTLNPPGSIPVGSYYIFSFQPAVTLTTTSAVKNYGVDLTGTVGTFFTTTAFINAATYGNVFTQDTPANSFATFAPTSPGASPTANVLGSPYAVTSSATATTGYALTINNAGLITVNAAALTITANNQSKTYGQTFNFAGTEFTSTPLQNGETIGSATISSAASSPTTNASVIPYTINISAATGGTFTPSNYNITYNTGLFTVNQANLTVTANNQSKTYGQTFNFSGTEFTNSALQNGETIGSATISSAASSPTTNASVIPYTINISAATGGTFTPSNYNITYNTGLFTVNQANLSITGNTTNSLMKTYGQTSPATTLASPTYFIISGLQNGETIGTVDIASAGLSPTAGVALSPYAITSISNAAGGTFNTSNYTITYTPTGSITVNPAALTIIANNQNKILGQAFIFTGTEFTTIGLVNSDSVTNVMLNSLGAPATATLAGSPYLITASTAVGTGLNNYAITYVNGLLSINSITLAEIATIPNVTTISHDKNNNVFSDRSTSSIVLGEVINVSGTVVVTNEENNSIRILSVGDNIYLGDKVTSEGNNSSTDIRITLTGEQVYVAPGSSHSFSHYKNKNVFHGHGKSAVVVGEVIGISGTVVVTNEEDNSVRVLSVGDNIYLGDKVTSEGKNSSTDIRIALTGEQVYVTPNSSHSF
jgi:hypothetical protein